LHHGTATASPWTCQDALSDRLGRKLTFTNWRLPYHGGGMAPLLMV
jgi:hypothetical protein